MTSSVHITGFCKIGYIGEACSNVCYLFVSITSVGEERPNFFCYRLLVNCLVSLRIGFLFLLVLGIGYAKLFYCGTPYAFYVIFKSTW